MLYVILQITHKPRSDYQQDGEQNIMDLGENQRAASSHKASPNE